jgi:hypothetical protein
MRANRRELHVAPFNPTGRFTSHTFPVTGIINASGGLSLTGSLEFVDPANLPFITALSSVRLLDWHSARVVDVMVGHLHSTVSGFYRGGPFFPQTFDFTSDLTAKRTAVPR